MIFSIAMSADYSFELISLRPTPPNVLDIINFSQAVCRSWMVKVSCIYRPARKESNVSILIKAKEQLRCYCPEIYIANKGQTDGLFGTISQATLEAEKADLFSLQNRHEEFLKLGNQIEEVAQLFKEIAILVECQGEIVDSIEQNVLKAEIQIEDGTKELGKAEKNTISSRKKKVACFSIIAVVIIIIVLVLIISLSE